MPVQRASGAQHRLRLTREPLFTVGARRWCVGRWGRQWVGYFHLANYFVDTFNINLFIPCFSNKSILNNLLDKPCSSSGVIMHISTTLNLHLLLRVVQMYGDGSRVWVNARAIEFELDKVARQVCCHIIQVTRFSTLYKD